MARQWGILDSTLNRSFRTLENQRKAFVEMGKGATIGTNAIGSFTARMVAGQGVFRSFTGAVGDTRAWNILRSTVSTTVSVFTSLWNVLKRVGAFFGIGGLLSVGVLSRMAHQWAQAWKEQKDFADQVGVTVDELRGLQYAAEEVGVGTGRLNQGLMGLQRNLGLLKMADGDEGGGPIQSFLEKVGDTKTLERLKQATTTTEAFGLVMQTVAQQTDKSVAAAFASAAFGGRFSGASLVRLASNWERLTAEQEQYLNLTNEHKRAADEASDVYTHSMLKVGAAWEGMKVTVLTPIMKLVGEHLDKLATWMSTSRNRQIISDYAEAGVKRVVSLIEWLTEKENWDTIKAHATSAFSWISNTYNEVMRLITGFEVLHESVKAGMPMPWAKATPGLRKAWERHAKYASPADLPDWLKREPPPGEVWDDSRMVTSPRLPPPGISFMDRAQGWADTLRPYDRLKEVLPGVGEALKDINRELNPFYAPPAAGGVLTDILPDRLNQAAPPLPIPKRSLWDDAWNAGARVKEMFDTPEMSVLGAIPGVGALRPGGIASGQWTLGGQPDMLSPSIVEDYIARNRAKPNFLRPVAPPFMNALPPGSPLRSMPPGITMTPVAPESLAPMSLAPRVRPPSTLDTLIDKYSRYRRPMSDSGGTGPNRNLFHLAALGRNVNALTQETPARIAANAPAGGVPPAGITIQARGPAVHITQAPPNINIAVSVNVLKPDEAPAATAAAVGGALGRQMHAIQSDGAVP
jgi:hypothetical protein